MSDTLFMFDTIIRNEKDLRTKLEDLSRDKRGRAMNAYWEVDGKAYEFLSETSKMRLEFDGFRLVKLVQYLYVGGMDIKLNQLVFHENTSKRDQVEIKTYNVNGNEFDGSTKNVHRVEFSDKTQTLKGKISYTKINIKKFGSIRYTFSGTRLIHLSMDMKAIKPTYLKLGHGGKLIWKERQRNLKPWVLGGLGMFLLAASAAAAVSLQPKTSHPTPVLSQSTTHQSDGGARELREEITSLRQELYANLKEIQKLKKSNADMKRRDFGHVKANQNKKRNYVKWYPVEELKGGEVMSEKKSVTSDEQVGVYKDINEAPKGANLYYNKQSKQFIDVNAVPAYLRTRFTSNADLYEKVEAENIASE